jgi:hypothetical protein
MSTEVVTAENVRWISCRGGSSSAGGTDNEELTFKEAALNG